METLLQKQFQEIRKLNPQTGIMQIVIMPKEESTSVIAQVSAELTDIGKAIHHLFLQFPEVKQYMHDSGFLDYDDTKNQNQNKDNDFHEIP